MRTGRDACRSTPSEMLPRTADAMVVRPREPRTIRSAFLEVGQRDDRLDGLSENRSTS